MDRVKTSFIPKTSLSVERSVGVRRTTVGIVNVISGVLLVAAIVGAIGMVAFEAYTKASIENKRASLDRARAAFQPATIKELARLDTRLTVGAALLGAHTAPSILLDALERETLASVRFKDFSLSEATPGRLTIAMAGEAKSFNAVALQSDAFGALPIFSEVIFSNLNINETGTVVFEFSAVVDIGEIAYRAPSL